MLRHSIEKQIPKFTSFSRPKHVKLYVYIRIVDERRKHFKNMNEKLIELNSDCGIHKYISEIVMKIENYDSNNIHRNKVKILYYI